MSGDEAFEGDAFDGDAPDGEAPAPRRTWWSSIFNPTSGRVSDPEVRERMRGLDDTERRIAFIAGGLALLTSFIYVPYLQKNTITWTPEAFGKHHVCAYTIVGKLCELKTISTPADFVPRFALTVVLAIVMLVCAYFKKRTLLIFSALFIGLFNGFFGILIFLFGGWLVLRSWRLQRYGAKDGATARKVAMERTQARREERKQDPGRSSKKETKSAPTPSRPVVTKSKRYTPKAKTRRR